MAAKKERKRSNAKNKRAFVDRFEGTIGENINQVNEDWVDDAIATGELFRIDIFEYTKFMDKRSQLQFLEKIDQANLVDLIPKYKLDYNLVKSWLDRYLIYRRLFETSNNQLISYSTTNEQIVLYYYLRNLGMINFDQIQDANKRAALLAFLFNRDVHNVRRGLRNADIKEREKKYYTEKCLNHILQLADKTELDGLKKEVERDLSRLYKKR